MFNRSEVVKISGLTERQVRRLDEINVLMPLLQGVGTEAQYTYNELTFLCVYKIIRDSLKGLEFGLYELNDKFKGGLVNEIDFIKNDIFFFNRACFFMIPSTIDNGLAVYKEWIKEPYVILPKLSSEVLQKFGLNVVNGLFLNTLVVNLHDTRTQIKDKCKQLGIEHKLPQEIAVSKRQKVAK